MAACSLSHVIQTETLFSETNFPILSSSPLSADCYFGCFLLLQRKQGGKDIFLVVSSEEQPSVQRL